MLAFRPYLRPEEVRRSQQERIGKFDIVPEVTECQMVRGRHPWRGFTTAALEVRAARAMIGRRVPLQSANIMDSGLWLYVSDCATSVCCHVYSRLSRTSPARRCKSMVPGARSYGTWASRGAYVAKRWCSRLRGRARHDQDKRVFQSNFLGWVRALALGGVRALGRDTVM